MVVLVVLGLLVLAALSHERRAEAVRTRLKCAVQAKVQLHADRELSEGLYETTGENVTFACRLVAAFGLEGVAVAVRTMVDRGGSDADVRPAGTYCGSAARPNADPPS